MLQIIQPHGTHRLIACPGSGDRVLRHGHEVIHGCNIAVVMSRENFVTYSTSGTISTWPSDCLSGENECSHLKYDGTLFPVNNVLATGGFYPITHYGDTEYDPPFYYMSDNITVQAFSRMIQFGQEISTFESFPSRLAGESAWNRVTYFGSLSYVVNGVMYVFISTDSGDRSDGAHVSCYAIEYTDLRGSRYTSQSGFIGIPIRNAYDLQSFALTYRPYLGGSYSLSLGTQATFGSPSLVSDHVSLLDHLLSKASTLLSPYNINWGELAYQCAIQITPWNSNGLALSRELIGLKKEISSVLSLIRGIDDPKTWSSVFLSNKYGLKLTISDSMSLIKSLRDSAAHEGPLKVSSSAFRSAKFCEYEFHYSIYYERYANAVADVYYFLDQFDALPTLQNVWDFIPYSFVADWFVDVGGALDRLDAVSNLSAYDIAGDMRSMKITRALTPRYLGLDNFGGEFRVISYTRVTSDSIETPSVELDLPITSGFDHWVESGALILQKLL